MGNNYESALFNFLKSRHKIASVLFTRLVEPSLRGRIWLSRGLLRGLPNHVGWLCGLMTCAL